MANTYASYSSYNSMSGSGAVFDPIVPTDGTQNITGGLTTTSRITGVEVYSQGGVMYLDPGANGLIRAASTANQAFQLDSSGLNRITSNAADGANTGVIINNSQTLSNASAKLLSIQNAAAEKAYFDKDGTPFVNKVRANFYEPLSAGGNIVMADDVGNTIATFFDDGSVGGLQITAGLAVAGVSAVKTAAYTALVTDSIVLASPSAAAGSFAITLPTAAARKGQILTVKAVTTHATNVVTVIRNGTDTIEGVSAGQTTTTFGTTANLASATFQSDGTSKWYLIATQGSVT